MQEPRQISRREVLARAGAWTAAGAAWAFLKKPAAAATRDCARRSQGRRPEDVARDEAYWRPIQRSFTVDRNFINLNNGGVSPAPRIVQEATKRLMDQANLAPSHMLWRIQEPARERVRSRLARLFGCDREEIALTRNASEALETCILGIDLKRGDEVVASNQNYPRMLQTWRQRELREGIRLKTFSVPTNPSSSDELVDAYARAIGPKTRVIEVCHVTNRNGQIWPVREICRLGRERGLTVIVDGAHAFAHFPFRRDDLECDYYGTSLHKWLCASHGTGFLYVRKERISSLWPLMAPPHPKSKDIRKFEEIGTHPAAMHDAVSEAITFHLGIGPANKAARLRYLHDRWCEAIIGENGARLLTNAAADQSCGIRLLHLPDVDAPTAARRLLKRHGIIVSPIVHPEFQGIRVSPNVYTTLDEIDRFIDAVRDIRRRG